MSSRLPTATSLTRARRERTISTPTTNLQRQRPDSASAGLPPDAASQLKKALGAARFRSAQARRIIAAAENAAALHSGQLRADGSPYIIHPVAVACIVAEWLHDEEAMIAALLHDAIEDTELSTEQLAEQYGPTVSLIVNGVTNIEKIEHVDRQERRAENFRKLLLAVASDWRVLLIKLADRIHNMRTLVHLPKRKRLRIAQETLDIYAPLAERLGFRTVRDELQMLSFSHIFPLRYAVLEQALGRSSGTRRQALPDIERKLKENFAANGIETTIYGRSKNLYSIYRKMVEKRLRFSEVDDIIGFRILVASRAECYQALGIIHEHFRPMPFKVKDYIGMPKNNGYQSLHTTVLDKSGVLIELQIRTERMHEFAEYGLAAHWHYKQNDNQRRTGFIKSRLFGQTGRSGKSGAGKISASEVQMQAARMLAGLLELPADPKTGGDFMHNLRIDLFPNDIYVLSPKGRVVHLPKGASALDFAYEIHTDLGDRAESAEINGRSLPISAKLASGDIIKVNTSKVAAPLPQWLEFVATSKARSRIRAVLRESWAEEMENFGAKLLEQALQRSGAALEEIGEQAWKSFFQRSMVHGSRQALLIELALGKIDPFIVAGELLGAAGGSARREKRATTISISGKTGAGIFFANCCSPVPPEEIIGLMQKGKGMEIHRKNCQIAASLPGFANHINLTWAPGDGTMFSTRLTLEATNRRRLFTDITSEISSTGINIANVNLSGGQEGSSVVRMEIEIEVNDAKQIERLLAKISAIPGVLTAQRAGAVSY